MRVLIVGAMVALLAACGGGGDDGSFTLATKIDFYTTPKGVLTAIDGSDALGCSRGTIVDNRARTLIVEVFSCTEGDRTGSFTIRFVPQIPQPYDGTEPLETDGTEPLETVSDTVETTWRFESGTGDFTGLDGNGEYLVAIDGNNFAAVGTLTGKVHY